MWRILSNLIVLLLVLRACSSSHASTRRQRHGGDVSTVYRLLDRVLGTNASVNTSYFVLKLCNKEEADAEPTASANATACSCSHQANDAWFCMKQQQQQDDSDEARLVITATSVSELSYGLGYYFRYYCNFTLGWDRIGGSVRNLSVNNDKWPLVDERPIRKRRRVPYSYLMNVCTHSYSLVWYDWKQGWEPFLDWASLMGINNLLALTGQEEIQYKVYQAFGLDDDEIRSWFNGPAFLTWSRGQNEYGAGIAGPLPRSWMHQQWLLQKNHILPRLRELNIIGQLPGFQGNVPMQIANLYPDSKMTIMGDTAWLDATDPLYTKIADVWMTTLAQDFGTDNGHWYQMDGYLNGGVPPWFEEEEASAAAAATVTLSETTFATKIATKIDLDSKHISTKTTRKLDGVQQDDNQMYQGPTSASRDELWYQRGVAAFTGLNRTDPDAVWSFQGFSFIGWNDSDITASWLKGFVESAPPGRFVVIDMSYVGLGQWTKWNNASYFGANFIWSALHNFGDTSGMKGDLNRIANILPTIQGTTDSMVGIGATPEGIDQNPVYYEFLLDQAFASDEDPIVPDVTSALVERSHRRYGGLSPSDPWGKHVTAAWKLLAESSYAGDQSVQDNTGVAHLKPRGGDSSSQFESDRFTPKPMLCRLYGAWSHLIQASADFHPAAPFTYDLINTGREVFAQLSVPMALNFSDALAEVPLDTERLVRTGIAYIHLLKTLDALVGTHSAFLVGPWIESARAWGGQGDSDCHASAVPEIQDCSHFYEWNARVQITTWNPTMVNDSMIPGGPIDYAAKHWSGLIGDYYAERASIVLKQALSDAGGALNWTEVAQLEATLAYQWSTSQKKYPTQPSGDPLLFTIKMHDMYSAKFGFCRKD